MTAGHYTDNENKTGCTVVMIAQGAVAGVDVRGSAPEYARDRLLRPANLVEHAHAFVISGGSAFGLAAADGVMHWLEEHGIGFDTGCARVPIVPAAVLYDGVGSAAVRPDAQAGYTACENADALSRLPKEPFGAGTGASVGKAAGQHLAGRGGFSTASITLPGGVIVAAGFAVNAFGDIFDHTNGKKSRECAAAAFRGHDAGAAHRIFLHEGTPRSGSWAPMRCSPKTGGQACGNRAKRYRAVRTSRAPCLTAIQCFLLPQVKCEISRRAWPQPSRFAPMPLLMQFRRRADDYRHRR